MIDLRTLSFIDILVHLKFNWIIILNIFKI